jgi:integrase/recombinase XerD
MKMVKTDKLILNKLGKPITVDGINAMTDQLKALYPDRPLTPQSIRMSVISNWLNEKKLPLEAAQELAGHKWPSTTEKYIREDNLKQRELINKYFPTIKIEKMLSKC